MGYVNQNILSGDDTGDVTGETLPSNTYWRASFVTLCGDTSANGTVQIQMSNDIAPSGNLNTKFEPTNWFDINQASATVTSGVADPILITDLSYRWMRAVYTSESGGSDKINVIMFAWTIP